MRLHCTAPIFSRFVDKKIHSLKIKAFGCEECHFQPGLIQTLEGHPKLGQVVPAGEGHVGQIPRVQFPLSLSSSGIISLGYLGTSPIWKTFQTCQKKNTVTGNTCRRPRVSGHWLMIDQMGVKPVSVSIENFEKLQTAKPANQPFPSTPSSAMPHHSQQYREPESGHV